MKISNLLDKDFKIVEKKKIFFLVPVAIVVITAICMLIYGLVLGSPLNLGMDFTGGYTLDVKLGTKLTKDSEKYYKDLVTDIVEGTDNGSTSYGLKVSGLQIQGEGADASLHIAYSAVAESHIMDDVINPKIRERLQNAIFNVIPVVSVDSKENQIKLDYDFAIEVESTFDTVSAEVRSLLADKNITVNNIELSRPESGSIRTMVVSCDSVLAVDESMKTEIRDVATITDKRSAIVSSGSTVSASFSSELLWTAFAAILASVVLMLVYIAFRFELTSGLAAIIALFHDILIMFCFMVIFRIPITSTFVAALITILGYSINNTIVIFDRVRENQKSMFAAGSSAAFIADKSVSETLLRTINTTVTTLLTIGMVAIIGVTDIRIFALPIIVGLLAGTYSSIFISPAIWASWKDRKKKRAQSKEKKQPTKAATVQ